MDILIEFIHHHLHIAYLIGAVIIALKLMLAISFKGFDFTLIVFSFISFYNHDRIATEKRMSKKRAFFMWSTNVLNLFFYVWLFIVAFYTVVTWNVNQF